MNRSARMPALRLSGLATVAAISFTTIPWYAGAQELATFQEGVSPTVDYAHDATYIRSNPVDGNFDDDTDLELIVGTTTSDDVGLRSLLEFDIREIPAFSQVDSVSLELKTHTNTGLDLGGVEGNPTFNVYAYGFDIDELGSTWNDPDGDGSETTGDTMAGGTLDDLLTSASFDVTATEQWITFADSPEFQAAVSAALEDHGFLRLIIAKDDESTAGRAGKTVILIEQSPVLGGMNASGVIRLDDLYVESNSGVMEEFRQRVKAYHRTELAEDPLVKAHLTRDPRFPWNVADGRAWEPHTAARIYAEMVAELDTITTRFNEVPVDVKMK